MRRQLFRALNCDRKIRRSHTIIQETEKIGLGINDKLFFEQAVEKLEQIEKDSKGKIPIMITGSSLKHWPKISDSNKLNMQVALDVLIKSLDPNKAYLVTGGTNHGVEKEAHILANRYNRRLSQITHSVFLYNS